MTMLKPLFLQSGSHPARDMRLAVQAMLGQPTGGVTRSGGVIPGFGGQMFCQQNGTPNMTVLVSSGAALIPGTASATQGSYPAVNDAQVSVSIAASHASLARIDVVCARVKDDQFGDASNEAVFEVVTGTPAGSPSVPALPANAVKLFEVAVGAGVTTIVNGNLTDRRVWSVAVGGVHPCLAAARPASPYSGTMIYETDTGRVHVYNGTASAWTQLNDRDLFVRRTSDATVVNNSTTLVSDSVLALAPAVSTTYVLDGFVMYTSNIAADFKFGFNFPAGATLSWTGGGHVVTGSAGAGDFASNAANRLAADSTFSYGGGDAFVCSLQVRGLLIMGGTAGNLTARWAQATAHASDTRTKTDSWLRLTPVA